MDQVIELLAFYWADWQQTAIANTRYSAVLAVLAFLIGGLVVAILKRGKIVRLMRQVMQGKQQLEKAEKTHEELLNKQKNDEAQIADFQQQLEQSTENLQKEKNEYQENILKKDELLTKSAAEKQQEIDAISTMLDEKILLTDRLQSDLNEQAGKIALYTEAQAKIADMEKEVSQSAIELNAVKQQLETELNNKNEQIEESAKTHIDRVSELELQLKTISDVAEAERVQQQAIIQQNKNNQILQEKQKLEEEAKPAEIEVKIEKPVQLQDPQPAISKEISQEQVKHSEPLKQKTALAKETNAEKQGVVGQVLGWFSSMDEVLEGDKATENNLEKSQQNERNQILQQKQKLEPKADPIENLENTVKQRVSQVTASIEKTQVQENHAEPLQQKVDLTKEPDTENKLESVVPEQKIERTAPVNKVKAERKPSIKDIPNPVTAMPDDGGSSFSEKLAEVADTMDSLQGRFKKFFKK